MADLHDLLNTSLDDIEIPILPPGDYKFQVTSASLGDVGVDKNGNEYVMATFRLRPMEAVAVDDKHALAAFEAANGYADTRLSYSRYIGRPSDIKAVQRLLERAGLPASGKRLDELLESVRGAGLVVHGRVSHNGDGRIDVDYLFIPGSQE